MRREEKPETREGKRKIKKKKAIKGGRKLKKKRGEFSSLVWFLL
jgi:hypothetical protein